MIKEDRKKSNGNRKLMKEDRKESDENRMLKKKHAKTENTRIEKNDGNDITEITSQFPEIFTGVGRICDKNTKEEFTVKFSMKPDATPVAQKQYVFTGSTEVQDNNCTQTPDSNVQQSKCKITSKNREMGNGDARCGL